MHNVGSRDLVLNLGTVVRNGAHQYPENIRLLLTFPGGKMIPLQLRRGGIAPGRVDPMIELLPAGASFVLPINLKDYASPDHNLWDLDLPPGKYAAQAEFFGAAPPPNEIGSDMKGVALMPYWTGKTSSAKVEFVVRSNRSH